MYACMYSVRQLSILLVLAPEFTRREGDAVPTATRPNGACSGTTPGLRLKCTELFYQEAISELRLEPPNLAIMFNPGIQQPHRRTWEPVLLYLMSHDVPTLISTSEPDIADSAKSLVTALVSGSLVRVASQKEAQLHALDGGGPYDWMTNEAWGAMATLIALNASVKHVLPNPFRFSALEVKGSSDYTPFVPCPSIDDPQRAQKQATIAAKMRQQVMDNLMSEENIGMTRRNWLRFPPTSADDFCFPWERLAQVGARRTKNAILLLFVGSTAPAATLKALKDASRSSFTKELKEEEEIPSMRVSTAWVDIERRYVLRHIQLSSDILGEKDECKPRHAKQLAKIKSGIVDFHEDVEKHFLMDYF